MLVRRTRAAHPVPHARAGVPKSRTEFIPFAQRPPPSAGQRRNEFRPTSSGPECRWPRFPAVHSAGPAVHTSPPLLWTAQAVFFQGLGMLFHGLSIVVIGI